MTPPTLGPAARPPGARESAAPAAGLKSWRDSSARERVKLVAFSLLPLLLLLALAEVLAASAIRRSFGVHTDPATGAAVYQMRIGRFPWSQQSRTLLNSMGYPDEEFAGVLPKEPGCRHVVFAGDSFVFGDGVDGQASFASLVERWSAERYPARCVRFFNVSERATTVQQQAEHVRRTIPLLDPDVVILGQYQNDLADLTKPGFLAHSGDPAQGGNDWRDAVRESAPVLQASFPRWLTYQGFALLIQGGLRYDVLDKWSMFENPAQAAELEELKTLYAGLYHGLVADLRARGTEFGVLILPGKFDLMAGRSPEQAYFQGLADQAGVPALPLLPALDDARRPYPFLMYDGHLNEQGNRVVAEAVMRWLFEAEPAPFAGLRE